MSQEKATTQGMNRAKLYQLILFPMNNGATNVYYILTLNFIAYYANGVLGLLLIFATTMVTVMRLFDAVTDPIIGALIDRTSTKFGKFRPFMVLGNVIMIVSSICLYFGTRIISGDMMWLRYVCFVLFYALYVIGYTFQTACTRSGQTCLTNDPKQRPLFTIFNTIASLIGMGLVQFLAPILSEKLGGYNSADFFNVMIPLAIVVSAVLTLLAVIGIWEKDRPEFFGVSKTQEKVKVKEYLAILKANKELQRLMIAGAGCKLAFSIATNMTVLCMLYGAMMGNYDGLYLPMMIVGYIFSVPFFLLTVRTSPETRAESVTGSIYRNRTGNVCWSSGTSRAVETGESGMELKPWSGQLIYGFVYHLFWNRIRGILFYRRYADPDGGRLLRLRDIPFRKIHSGDYGNLVLAG